MAVLRQANNPARVIAVAYLAATIIGTLLLMLPAATNPGQETDLLTASFHAVSALCITGLSTVDTPKHWSFFGQAVILALIQLGGFGIVALATTLAAVVTGRIGLSSSVAAGSEMHARSVGDAWRLPRKIAVGMLASELVIAVLLTLRFRSYTDNWAEATWSGVFHAVSSFNNAGFSLYSTNLMGFVDDPFIILPICVAIVAGGLGFPVYFELWSRRRWRRPSGWSVHARITVWGTITLLLAGTALFALFEWNNPATLGELSIGGKILGSLGGGVFPRTAGFNSIDYAVVSEQSIALNYLLMFIGGGSAGTAGGIKVGTFFILFAAIRAEIAGETQTTLAHRSIAHETLRQALTVVLLGVTAVGVAAAILLFDTRFTLSEVLFECISAFGTVGLTMNLTARLPPESLIVLMVLMFLGRVGTISVAAALAKRHKHRRYRLPEERPLVG